MIQATTVDVIIPAYRPGASFRELVGKLSSQSHQVSHILIVNTGEEFWDDELIRGYDRAEVFHITKAEFDHAGTRNMGVGFSQADYLLFMTQDAIPADRYMVEHLVDAFSNPIVKAAYARQLPKSDCFLTEGCVRNYNYPAESRLQTFQDLGERGVKAYFCSNVCAMYERELFLKMGGFSAPAIFNEDMVYAARIEHLGYAVAYAAEAAVYHSHNYSSRQQFQRNFDNGVSQAMHPELFKGAPATGEGKKLVKYVARCLRENGRWYLLPGFYWQCLCRLAGFQLGKRYKSLPKGLVRRWSMSPGFFEK